MSPKAHGTSEKPVMKDLKWGCDYDTADRICNFNRHYAEVCDVLDDGCSLFHIVNTMVGDNEYSIFNVF